MTGRYMSRRLGLLVLFTFMTSLLATKELTEDQGNTETRVSELRKNGRYVRVTQTFKDNVLVAEQKEVSVRDDGRINFVFFKLFEDGEMTYACTIDKDKKRGVRSYHNEGKVLVMEGDEDGDGFYEVLILFDAKEQPVAAFERGKDGVVKPWDKERCATLRRSFEVLQE